MIRRAALVALLAGVASAAVELYSAGFDDKWKATDLLLVEFYINGSASHGELASVLPEALEEAQARGVKATLAAVDVEQEPRLRKRFHVAMQGPRHDRSVLKLFRRDLPEPVPYTRAWTANAVADFLFASTGVPARTLTSVSEAVELTEGEKTVVIGFFETHDVKEYEAFTKASRAFLGTAVSEAVLFAEVLEPALIKEFEVVYTPMTFIFKPGEDALGYTGKYEVVPLQEWVQAHAVDLVRELRPDNFLQLLDEARPALMLFHEPADPRLEMYREHLAHAAATFGDGLDFIRAPRTQYEGLVSRLGMNETGSSLAVLDFGKREHYVYDRHGGLSNLTSESVAEFVQDYLSGALSPVPEAAAVDAHGGTEALPSSLEEIPETVVIANPSPDTLMDFWVPWCDFYIHISVPAEGAPRVSIPKELPQFAAPDEALDAPPPGDEGTVEDAEADSSSSVPSGATAMVEA